MSIGELLSVQCFLPERLSIGKVNGGKNFVWWLKPAPVVFVGTETTTCFGSETFGKPRELCAIAQAVTLESNDAVGY